VSTLHIALSAIWIILIGVTALFAYRNYRRWKLNEYIALELDAILQTTLAQVKATKNLAKTGIADPNSDAFQSPEMLSTMLTVLVRRQETVRLSLNDFASIGDEDYVSVYVDYDSKELILSMNHSLVEEKEAITMANFGGTDDTTFH
tara:strand:- start:7623 stop:8063 length:441 start_codon:yes stop_codon:yes gene_type:complete